MSTELKYLAFTALLTASLWIPYVVAQVKTNGFLDPGELCRPEAAPAAVLGPARGPRLPQRGRDICAVCGAGSVDSGDRQSRRHDGLLGDQLLLAPRCPCRRLPGRLALYPHADLCSRLDLHSRAVRRAGEVALPPDAVTRPERDDLSSKCRPARVICLRVIPRIEPDGMLLRTPRPTPDQVRGQAFGIMLYSRPARRKAST